MIGIPHVDSKGLHGIAFVIASSGEESVEVFGGRKSILMSEDWSNGVIELDEGIVGSGNELDVLGLSSIEDLNLGEDVIQESSTWGAENLELGIGVSGLSEDVNVELGGLDPFGKIPCQVCTVRNFSL